MSSIPDPATTEWVPLGTAGGGGSADLVYNGQYPAGGPNYTDGDIVIGADNVAYLCVRPTSSAPTPWTGVAGPVGPAGPQGPQGPTGAQGPGLPTVVNGQWLKGVSGAAVWAAITQDALPVNLQAGAPLPTPLDCNLIAVTGWYWADNSVANCPIAGFNGWIQTFVAGWSNLYRVQIARVYGSLDVYERRMNNGTWSTWIQVQWNADANWINFPTPHSNGWVNYPSYPPARYRRMANGMIILGGLLQTPGTNSVFNNLPVGYRPDIYRHLASMGNDGIASVRISTNGDVQLYAPSGAWMTLDGVSFFP